MNNTCCEALKMSDCVADILEEVLNCTWGDNDLARLALHIVSWEELAPFWGLTEAEEEEIKRDNPNYAAQKLAALRRWKAKSPDAATYHQLVRVFSRLGKMELVEKIREIVLSPEEVPAGGPEDVLSSYQEFLRKNYIQLPHPGMLANQWPILNAPAYVQLSLSKQPIARSQRTSMEQLPTGSSLSIPFWSLDKYDNEVQEVHLPELLSKCSGRSIAIRGLPGSGKTTLTWHASQQWAKKEEFQQFSLFLSIPLCNTRVQQATCLADLIPHPDQEYRKAIAQVISARDGEGVCFWFDGWDEMPQEVQKESFIASFIQRDTPGSSLPKSTTVVTARPETFSPKNSEEIWLNGLSVDQVNEIISKSVEGTDRDPSELITKLERSSSLQAFCLTVPINIAILVTLFFLFKSGLPNTQTELFNCLILNLLLRNLQLRWKLDIATLKSFTALPDIPAESFKSICEVAFNGIMNGKTVFLRSDVPSVQKQQALSLSTFGLMEIRPQMEWYGVEEELTFPHTTLQEFLAAVHLTTLKNEEKVRVLKEIVKSDSGFQKSILKFFVGLTRPDNTEVIITIVERYAELKPVGQSISYGAELESFLTLLSCVFEAQSGRLCHKLSQTLCSKEFDISLVFEEIRFNTADFSHLGYFIGWFCQQKTCELEFVSCYITPQQFEVFVDQIKQVCTLNECHSPSLSLRHAGMNYSSRFQFEQVHALCGLIKDTHLVSKFDILVNFASSIHPQAFIDYCATMKSIIEAFARNSSCNILFLMNHFLILDDSSVATRYSEYYAVLLITFCRHVKVLAFRRFFQCLDYAYPLFACALQYNTNIQVLDLFQDFLMSDQAITNLAQALSFNGTITEIIFGDFFKIDKFLNHYEFYRHESGLEAICMSSQVVSGGIEDQLRKINFIRLLSRRRQLEVTSASVCEDKTKTVYFTVYTGFTTYVIRV